MEEAPYMARNAFVGGPCDVHRQDDADRCTCCAWSGSRRGVHVNSDDFVQVALQLVRWLEVQTLSAVEIFHELIECLRPVRLAPIDDRVWRPAPATHEAFEKTQIRTSTSTGPLTRMQHRAPRGWIAEVMLSETQGGFTAGTIGVPSFAAQVVRR